MNKQTEIRLRRDLKDIENIKDLRDYLSKHQSPVVVTIIEPAIQFFSDSCENEHGLKDWKAVKQRKKLGLHFQLTDQTVIDTTVANALREWILRPGYGRDIGTDPLDALVSYQEGEITNPREEAHSILEVLSRRPS